MVPGALNFLQAARAARMPVWCLSNDVERWSRKLRDRFGIEAYLAGSVISSEARARKPSREIYRHLLARCGCEAAELVFLDDREKNVAAARELGIRASQFSGESGFEALRGELLDHSHVLCRPDRSQAGLPASRVAPFDPDFGI